MRQAALLFLASMATGCEPPDPIEGGFDKSLLPCAGEPCIEIVSPLVDEVGENEFHLDPDGKLRITVGVQIENFEFIPFEPPVPPADETDNLIGHYHLGFKLGETVVAYVTPPEQVGKFEQIIDGVTEAGKEITVFASLQKEDHSNVLDSAGNNPAAFLEIVVFPPLDTE